MSSRLRFALALLLLFHLSPADVSGQWTNRYPKVANFAHHVYLEGYNLPTLAAGPTDPAVAPDGRSVVVAARGWLWLVDLTTREARRLTRGRDVDSRPAWSPDGKRLAFVRDDTRDTNIWLLDVAAGTEKLLVGTPALDLDPAFSRDGKSLFYSSAEAGDIDLWRLDLATGAKTRLTTDKGLELQPQPLADDGGLLFVTKAAGGATDTVSLLDLRTNTRRVLIEEGIASQMRAALRPDGRSMAVNLPTPDDRWHLWLYDLRGGPPIRLTHDGRLPLAPAWTPDGAHVYFVEADAEERFHLWRTSVAGGAREEFTPVSWNRGEPTSRVTIKTRRAGAAEGLPARLSVVDRDGHPALPDAGQPRFDGQNGTVFFYTPGTVTLEVPAGEVSVTATHGFATEPARASRKVRAGESSTVEVELPPALWNPAAEGWYGADLHQHLNYGGPYSLTPEDLVLNMRAEALDLATPQLANLHTRFIDLEWWNWRGRAGGEPPLVVFSQEVRSHFLGHVGLIAAGSLYWPWYYGPGYPVYYDLDLPNSDALGFARAQGGVNSYVHPVSIREPFPAAGPPRGIPLELVPDAVLGDVDTLEVACLWSDELGTSDLWYRLLNLGLAVAPAAGSDSMHNFYRTMAIGSTRVYARTDGPLNAASYFEALKGGRSFVTTGPLVRFEAGGAAPGGVVAAAAGAQAGGPVAWKLDVWSALPVEKVEIVVNGQVAWGGKGLDAAGHKTFSGTVNAPRGGWVAARVYGGATRWPSMDSYPFAHTAPVWFGRTGSANLEAARSSAQDLLRWLDEAERRLNEGYSGAPVARLRARFADARRKLELIARQ